MTSTSVILTVTTTVPAQTLLYVISLQKPLRVDTHFTDAETDSMPAQRSLLSTQVPPPATPREWSPSPPCGIGWKGVAEWDPGRKLPHHRATNPSKKQTLSCYILTANCRGLKISQEALQGLWLVGAPTIHSVFPGQLPRPEQGWLMEVQG